MKVEGAQHTSCTVEMVDVNKSYDVAVVDECQLIGDRCACTNARVCPL